MKSGLMKESQLVQTILPKFLSHVILFDTIVLRSNVSCQINLNSEISLRSVPLGGAPAFSPQQRRSAPLDSQS